MTKGIFSLAYAGSVNYYAAMLGCESVSIDAEERRIKTPWECHHCRIVGANGPQVLTIPIVKPHFGSDTPVRDLEISEHGDWRRIHWGALFSAYGKSPFFDYIASDLQAIYSRGDKWLIDFDMAVHNIVVDFLDLPITMGSETSVDAIDFRGKVGTKNVCDSTMVQYWQVWQERYGFQPDMSIFDLLMNCGREAIFILLAMNSYK